MGKMYGKLYTGGKSRRSKMKAVVIGEKLHTVQLTSGLRKVLNPEISLVVFGVEDRTIYLNFLSQKENNNYDTYTISKNGSLTCRTFLSELGLKKGTYPVTMVTPTVYKFERGE